jgi:DNA repair exonuclease SbcCD ATPase subunit
MPKEGAPMADPPETPEPPRGAVLEMPWVLLSNQIQQLNDNLNARLSEQKAYLDDHLTQAERRFDERLTQLERRLDARLDEHDRRFAQLEAQIDQRFTQVDQRFAQLEQRFDRMDRRFDALDQRLAFRVNIWVTVVIAALTAILGALLAHVWF